MLQPDSMNFFERGSESGDDLIRAESKHIFIQMYCNDLTRQRAQGKFPTAGS